MNEIVNTFLLEGDKFMPEMHLKLPGFTYSACGSFTKNRERIQKFKETRYTCYIYKNEPDKASKVYHMIWLMGILKIFFKKRTASDKVLRDKAFNIAKNPKYDGYQRGLASMVYEIFNKKPKGSAVNMPLEFNEQLAKKFHKPIIKRFGKRTVYSRFKDNIWGADLALMQLISKFNKEFRFLLCVIDILVSMLKLFL